MEKQMKCRLAGETEVLGENLPQRHFCHCMLLLTGLGDAWGAAPPPTNPRESCIKELGSHLLQVTLAYKEPRVQAKCNRLT
jgi:hypothetical protein